jgi:hypothetical protein
VECDALLLDEEARTDTYPYIEINDPTSQIGHEATVSKIGDEQLFYLMSRGLSEDAAATMVVRGLHRADRQGASAGVRGGAEPADRAGDGRERRLTPVPSAKCSVMR